MTMEPTELRALTVKVVAAFVANNAISPTDLPVIISSVHSTLQKLADGTAEPKPVAAEPPAPAVPIRKSVHAEHIVCLECGQKLKMLRRHLRADHDMTPEDYRVKWSLPSEYPMVAPNYAKARSEMAVKTGLGRRGKAGD